MSRIADMLKRMAALSAALLCAASVTLAQETVQVYIQKDAAFAAEQVIGVLERRYPDVKWERITDEQDLRALVMADQAPQLAICSPGEAQTWAAEGLLLPLQMQIGGQRRIQRQALDACVWNEQLFMAPLAAAQRQIAVNVNAFEERRMERMLDRSEYPAWYPAQFQQILEEFALSDMTPLEIWLSAEDGAALEALVQAIYGGVLALEEGDGLQLDTPEIRAGMEWLADLLESGIIGAVKSRTAALERFVRGETAMFIDWTENEAIRQAAALEQSGVEIQCMPYPAALGAPVRSCEIVGVCAFDSGNETINAAALSAAGQLYETAQTLPRRYSVARDDSIWLACLSGTERGATLSSLFSSALEAVLGGERSPKEALLLAQAALDALQ